MGWWGSIANDTVRLLILDGPLDLPAASDAQIDGSRSLISLSESSCSFLYIHKSLVKVIYPARIEN